MKDLPAKGALIAPSILSADFARLGEEVRAVLAAGADCVTLVDENGVPRGTITLAAMRTRLTARDGTAGEMRPLPIK